MKIVINNKTLCVANLCIRDNIKEDNKTLQWWFDLRGALTEEPRHKRIHQQDERISEEGFPRGFESERIPNGHSQWTFPMERRCNREKM